MAVDRDTALTRLRNALDVLASPGPDALPAIPQGCGAHDLAREFHDEFRVFVGNFGAELSADARAQLEAVDKLLAIMRRAPDADHWTDAAVVDHPQWVAVREAAELALETLPDAPSGVPRHAVVLRYHDPGVEEFDCVALRFAVLWEELVPESGVAASGQGEVIRLVGRLADEDRRNGCINWDEFYESMVEFLRAVLPSDAVFDAEECVRIHEDLDLVVENGRRGVDFDVIRVVFGRLIMDAVAYCRAHPHLVVPDELPRVAPLRRPVRSWWRFW